MADLSGGVPEESVLGLMGQINEAARALHRLPRRAWRRSTAPRSGPG
ncbi:hypothetical protein [Pseudonocardia zijingensis]